MARLLPALCAALALSPMLPAPLAAADESYARDPVVIIDHGVICQVTPDGSREAPDTMVGAINLIEQSRDMDVTTRVVPARTGISFGVKFTLRPGAGDRSVAVIVSHPPMGPDGVTTETWIAPLSEGRASLNLFTFEFPYELVPGPWTMALEGEDGRLMEQHFEVVSELAAPAVLSVCYGQDFVS